MNADEFRSFLANERTLLAYIRTALAAGVFGMAAIKFFSENLFFVFLGWVMTLAGILMLFWGIWQFKKRRKMVKKACPLSK